MDKKKIPHEKEPNFTDPLKPFLPTDITNEEQSLVEREIYELAKNSLQRQVRIDQRLKRRGHHDDVQGVKTIQGYQNELEALEAIIAVPPSIPKDTAEQDNASNKDSALELKLCDANDVETHMELMSHEARKRTSNTISRILRGKGFIKDLRPVVHPDALAVLDEEFPIFTHITKYVRMNLRLYEASMKASEKTLPLYLKPILISGPPGYGKTSYLKRLAEVLNTPFHMMSMGTSLSSMTLAGLNSSYTDSKPGKIHDILMEGDTANPMILLDELDKMVQDRANRPDGPLYSLLEMKTAQEFRDEFAGYAINASAICWVATANDLHHVPDAIKSRFQVFDIKAPTGLLAAQTARQVFKSVLKDNAWGHLFLTDLTDDVVEKVMHHSPREMIRMMILACAYAVEESRDFLIVTDFDHMDQVETRRKIGFA